MHGYRTRLFVAPAVLLASALIAMTAASPAGSKAPMGVDTVAPSAKKPPSGWQKKNAQGIPRALAADGWGDVPTSRFGIGWERWTYPQFPIACSPKSSPLPAYQVIWVTNASRPRTDTVLDTNPGMVWSTFRRVASVFAASNNAGIRSQKDLEQSLAPRFVTTRAGGGCRPVVDRVRVPAEVLAREDIQNWVNPATGERERGLWSYLETHGYPARNDRRYIAIVDDTRAPDLRWFGTKGHAIIPAAGGGYGPPVLDPSQQNRNNAGGTWLTVFTNGYASDFTANGGGFGPALAHELAHTLGATLEGSPHYNDQSFGHPSDCADLLCYNKYDQPGQHYTACSSAVRDTYQSFAAAWGGESKAAHRLDCGRDDYFAVHPDGSGEKPWADERWSGSRSQFLWGNQHREPYAGEPFSNPSIRPSCLYMPDGYCPPGVSRPRLGRLAAEPSRTTWWVVS